jgi:hypothetical protein
MFPGLLAAINCIFMILSALIAFWAPFELLLFSYAVLGPAHYLTEISWLHDRHYFTTGDRDYWFLVCATILSLMVPIPVWDVLIISLFIWALVLIRADKLTGKMITLGSILLAVCIARYIFNFGSTLAVMLVTLIHVYVFTGIFILVGALKRQSVLDILSLVIFIACPIVLFILPISNDTYTPSQYTIQGVSYFMQISDAIISLFGYTAERSTIITIMKCTAFAYTYHYLNWFSKTKIIRWHDISKLRLLVIFTLYSLSLAAYYLNYGFGFNLLLFLSLLHVVLEFPLNHRSFQELGRLLHGAPAGGDSTTLDR